MKKVIIKDSIESVFPDAEQIKRIISDIAKHKFGEINSILIVKKNKLVLEEYFNNFTRNDVHDLFSVTKSIVSLVLGKLIEKGQIESDEAKILNYLPNVRKKKLAIGVDKLRIKDLLTMTSGIKRSSEYSDDPTDIKTHAIEILSEQDDVGPGNPFRYLSFNPHLISHIIYNATGKNIEEHAKEYFFEPLEIINYKWRKAYCGVTQASFGLSMTPIDMAKFGILVLNSGKYYNYRLLNSKWIQLSTQKHVYTNDTRSYGYYWWIREYVAKGFKFTGFSAEGARGQRIICLPGLDLTFVFTADIENPGKVFANLIQNYFLPLMI